MLTKSTDVLMNAILVKHGIPENIRNKILNYMYIFVTNETIISAMQSSTFNFMSIDTSYVTDMSGLFKNQLMNKPLNHWNVIEWK